MANCPFCSDILLRHIRSGKSYWLCRSCRTEILDEKTVAPVSRAQAQDSTGEQTSSLPHNRSASVQINHSAV
jgi:ribosomal protein L37AE/L43A